MNRTNGIILFRNVLALMKEAEYIDGDIKGFLERCMDDYIYEKKLKHSLESLFQFKKHLLSDELELEGFKKELGSEDEN